MGQILRSKCARCDFKQELFVGGGLADLTREAITLALPEKQRYLMEAGAVRVAQRLSVNRSPALCRSCGKLFVRAFVRYEYNGKAGTIRGCCPHCGADDALDLNETSVVEHACPKCGSMISFEPAGHWD